MSQQTLCSPTIFSLHFPFIQLPDHDQVPVSLSDRHSQDELPTADSLFGDSGSFLSQSANRPPPPPAAVMNAPVRPLLRPPPNPATAQTQQFRPVRPIRPARPPMNPPHLAAQRPQYSQQHPPSQTRPMVPPQNPTRPPPPRPQDQLRPNHQQNSQQPMPANQHSPQLAYQQRPHPVSPQMNPRPYSPQMQPRPPQLQRPPPNHAFSPRPNTLNQPQSSPQYRPEVIHPRPALPPLAPIVPVVSTQEASHHPVPNLINKAQTRTLGAQQGPSKSTDDTNDASSLFGAMSASASEKAALPSADVLFGSGPSSMDFFRQPPATIKYAPIQRRSMDTHRHPDKSTATSQQDVDSLFSSPATVTVTKQQDVGPQFASPVTMAAATIHHQETHSGIMLPQIESISRITSPPFRSADIFSLGGFQDSRSSQPAPILDPPTAVSQSTDVSAESNAFSSATPQRASPTNHYEAPLSPTGPVVSALNNNNRGSFDVGLNVTDTKVSQALHHQDSSSLFGGSDDTDASRFFSGPSAMDSSAFFRGLSQPGASAAHIGNASSKIAKANNDAIQPIFSPVLLSSAETDRTVELVARRDLEPTPASRPPAQSAAAAVTGSAADFFGQPSPQDFFSSSFFKNSENQGASETTAIVEASTANLRRTIFSNLERSTVDRADAGSNFQLKETQHDTNTMSSTHVLPVSLRESQRPPHSFRDAPSSQRHDKPQVPVYLQHSPESDHTTVSVFHCWKRSLLYGFRLPGTKVRKLTFLPPTFFFLSEQRSRGGLFVRAAIRKRAVPGTSPTYST